MIQSNDCIKRPGRGIHIAATLGFAVSILLLMALACGKKIVLPPYDDFIGNRDIPKTLQEIYGDYTVKVGERTFSSKFNLLLDPGKQAYLEILDASKTLLYAVSMDQNQVSMLWAQDRRYISEKATASNLNAILGMPALPDDMLMLIGGQGLNFPQWTVKQVRKNGWDLTREAFESNLILKDNVSRINLISNFSPALEVNYEDYRMMNNQSIPTRIRFLILIRDLQLKLDIEKVIPRDEAATAELFAIKVPEDAARLKLFDVYHGKPLILIEPVEMEERAEAATEAEEEQAQTQPQTQTQPLTQTQTQPQTQPN